MAYEVGFFIMFLAKKLIRLLIKKKITIGSVESLTGGSFISSLVKIPNASKVVVGSLVTYQTNFKISLLHVKRNDINKYGVVSEKIANEMVKKASLILNSNITVSFTGNAGPKKEKGKAKVGEVYVSILFKTKNKKEKIVNFNKLYSGTRIGIIRKNIYDVINLIIDNLK